MSRRRYLLAYDIRDPKRLRAVHDVVVGFGEALQYSVFICDVSAVELITLKTRLRDEMDLREDSVVLVDLGEPNARGTDCFQFMGTRRSLPPPAGARIV